MESSSKFFTYKEWLDLDSKNQNELVDGQLIMMAPPLLAHQRISVELSRQISNFLLNKSGEVFTAPFGVRLFKEKHTALQPDLTVVCDTSKLYCEGCVGAPDMVVEILSDSSSSYDKKVKLNLYLEAGVKEYWIVDPDDASVMALRLENGKYVASAFGREDLADVAVLQGCVIDLASVFKTPI
jgi:Uma2 family endonuclease